MSKNKETQTKRENISTKHYYSTPTSQDTKSCVTNGGKYTTHIIIYDNMRDSKRTHAVLNYLNIHLFLEK